MPATSAGTTANSVVGQPIVANTLNPVGTLKMSPAMAAGVSKRVWEMKDIVDMLEAWEAAQ
jgi:hypothetical protein